MLSTLNRLQTGSLRRAGRAALLLLGLCIAAPAMAADCPPSGLPSGRAVLDPELQGTYSGPCVDGLAHGQGVAQGSARYSGAFVAGRKHGIGVKEWPNGDRYEGAFVDDMKQGYGSYVWGPRSQWPGQRYSGSYVNDRRHGAGVYTWPDGRELAGQWQEDRPPSALPPAMQATVRAHAERMVALSRPGAKVCRNVPVGTVQVDTVSAVVQSIEGDRVRLRIERVGKFSNQLDGRAIVAGDELVVEAEHWFPCR